MGTKTISLRDEAYERLKRARRSPSESFSDVVMRATWDREPMRAGEYLTMVRERGPLYQAEGLDLIEETKRTDAPPKDKWAAD
jgi:predicted CopG family antitoxin